MREKTYEYVTKAHVVVNIKFYADNEDEAKQKTKDIIQDNCLYAFGVEVQDIDVVDIQKIGEIDLGGMPF